MAETHHQIDVRDENLSFLDRLGRWLNWKRFIFLMFLSFFLMVILFPFYWMVSSSFKSAAEIAGRQPVYKPGELRLDAFRELFDPNAPSYRDFLTNIINSLKVAIPTSLIAVILSTLGA